MRVRSVANDGLLVYVDLYAEEPYDKILELRFEHDTYEHYTAQLWGNFLQTYIMYDETRNVDRVFVRLPHLESRMVLPIYMERTLIYRAYWPDSLFLLYDRGRMPYHILGISGDYYINQTGFHIQDATVALDYTGDLPFKVKMLFTETDYNATFELIDPINLLKKWEVTINNGALSINGNAITTLTEGLKEVDFGFTANKLVLTFYENDQQVYVARDTAPLNEATTIDNTIMQITAQGLTIEDYMIFRAAPEPTTVVGSVDYTDIFELITSGFPKLNYPQRNGIEVVKVDEETITTGTIRKVAEGTDVLNNGAKIVIGEYHFSDSPVELVITKDIDDRFACELIVTQDITDDFGAELKIVTVTKVAENGIKITIPTEDIWYYGILSELREYFDNKYGVIRTIQGFDESFQGVRVTVSAGDQVNDVANFGIFIDMEKFQEAIIDYLVIAMKKYYGYARIIPQEADDIIVLADNYEVEVKVSEA